MSVQVWDKESTDDKPPISMDTKSAPDRPSPERAPKYTRLHGFLTIFVIVYLMEAMGGMYIVSAIQNIEKQFQLPSRLSGILVSASDIGYIPTVIFIAYFGARGNRARWIGAGTLGMAVAYLLIASPNFLFPTPILKKGTFATIKESLEPSNELLSPTASIALLLRYPLISDRFTPAQMKNLSKFTVESPADLEVEVNNKSSPYMVDYGLLHEAVLEGRQLLNSTENRDASKFRSLLATFISRRKDMDGLKAVMSASNAPFAFCSRLVNGMQAKIREHKCMNGDDSNGPFIVFCLALLLLGIGRTLPWSLGVPLIDDNVSKKSMPTYFGAISFIRILGPISGFLVASFVNKLYFDFHPPEYLKPEDSQWIGAWWLGFIIIGVMTIIPSIALCLFPTANVSVTSEDGKQRKINFNDKHHDAENAKKGFRERIKDFVATYRSVLTSKIYVYSATGRILDIMAFKGYIVFLPKYLENHFGIPRYLVHRYMAIFGVFGFALGSGMGGLLTRKFKLNGKRVAAFVFLVSLGNIIMYSSKIFIACDSSLAAIGRAHESTKYNLTKVCNADCACDGAKLYPVCDESGTPFFSPCHAGCREVFKKGPSLDFSACACAAGGSVSKEWCQTTCKPATVAFFSTVLLGSFIGGLGIVPGLLILIRSVPPASRSAALGLQGFLVSLFGTLPSPIIWGIIVDSTCLIWEKSCDGSRGSCSIYDPVALRYKLHIAYITFRLIALISDVLVYREADSIDIMEDDVSMEEVARDSIKLRDLSVKH
ncbi:hypothetical protein PFISCL1PPCAC_26160 [Pristionchus fissidentatus]|uniref:Solute carrier organic anion transporter family member n=1 Tax=Pristionchus fissidentatus TaxID=1538716 RepID=A0AAV5WU68_9BILA|nr:hypothetical protein PFISCL1PPCAC_26160 [Pristionchus fissidentatus]